MSGQQLGSDQIYLKKLRTGKSKQRSLGRNAPGNNTKQKIDCQIKFGVNLKIGVVWELVSILRNPYSNSNVSSFINQPHVTPNLAGTCQATFTLNELEEPWKPLAM